MPEEALVRPAQHGQALELLLAGFCKSVSFKLDFRVHRYFEKGKRGCARR